MSQGVQKIIIQYQKYSRPYLTKVKTDHLLINQKTGKGLKYDTIYKRIKHLSEKANINKAITLHQLRHSIASHLLEKGMQLEQIAQFLGHKSLDSTQIYTHIVVWDKK
jgi:site-specific recombinase XerD